jgi:hypothetical protein
MKRKVPRDVPVLIRLNDDDLRAASHGLSKGRNRVLSDGDTGAVMKYFPKMVANRLKEMVPESFVIAAVELEFAVSGSVFGNGVSGKGKVVFSPKAAVK